MTDRETTHTKDLTLTADQKLQENHSSKMLNLNNIS